MSTRWPRYWRKVMNWVIAVTITGDIGPYLYPAREYAALWHWYLVTGPVAIMAVWLAEPRRKTTATVEIGRRDAKPLTPEQKASVERIITSMLADAHTARIPGNRA